MDTTGGRTSTPWWIGARFKSKADERSGVRYVPPVHDNGYFNEQVAARYDDFSDEK